MKKRRRNLLEQSTETVLSSHRASDLPLSDIRIDGGTQMREMIHEPTVEEYAQDMAAGDQFPPIIVFFDGSDYWLGDGFHRVSAARSIQRERIAVEVRSGSRREAILHAVGANRSHGLRRTNLDKRMAAQTLLHDPEWSQWSDREIARRCGVSQPFISKMRAELALSDNGYQIPAERKVQRGGQEYTQKVREQRKVVEFEQVEQLATAVDSAGDTATGDTTIIATDTTKIDEVAQARDRLRTDLAKAVNLLGRQQEEDCLAVLEHDYVGEIAKQLRVLMEKLG